MDRVVEFDGWLSGVLQLYCGHGVQVQLGWNLLWHQNAGLEAALA
jgi:hypothetical protein